MSINYINPETEELMEYVSDGARQRERYILKPLTKDYVEMLKQEMPFTITTTGYLDEINPLVPKEFFDFGEKVAFMKLKNQKYGDLGFVMFGEFHNDEYKPDSLSIYLGRKTLNEKGEETIRIWKNIKNTPGFEDIYKFGNTPKVQKSVVVSGRNADNRGTIVTDTNKYDILSGLRVFLDKAEISGSQANRLIKGIYNNEYAYLDPRPVYKKVDSWTTKLNDLVSGKLENVLFTRSQVRDTDFAHTKSNMGDPYFVSTKLDTDVFEEVSKGVRRGSMKNRIEFARFLEIEKSNLFNDEKTTEKYNLAFLKDRFVDYNVTRFSENFNTFGQLKEVLGGKTGNVYYEKTSGIYDKNGISGKVIMELIDKKRKNLKSGIAEDYFNKREVLKTELYKLMEKSTVDKTFNEFRFNKGTVLELIKKIDKDFDPHKKLLVEKMKGVIGSKANYVFDKSYAEYLKNPKSYMKAMNVIEKDIIREFYDRYNEKADLFEMMTDSRRDSLVSEVDMIASRVEFIRNKDGKIIDAKIHDKPYFGVNKLDDKELRYKFFKRKHQLGKKFDELTFDQKLASAEKYGKGKNGVLDTYKDLFKKHSEKSSLGKYDNYKNFMEANKKTNINTYEMVAGDVLSRTTDKILGKFDLETKALNVTGSIMNENSLIRLNINFKKEDGFDKNNYVKEHVSEKQAAFKEMDLATQQLITENDKLYYKSYNVQKLIQRIQRTMENNSKYSKEYERLNQFSSFLKGGVAKKDKPSKLALDSNGFLFVTKSDKDFEKYNLKKVEDYNVIYDNIVTELSLKYGDKVGYLLAQQKRDKDENMKSTTELLGDLLVKTKGRLNNATYMAIMNHDQITNYSGSSKQQSLIRGNMYFGNPGIAQPGLTWNKYSQRTYQAQDLLGERYITTSNNEELTVSQIHANILKRLGMSGVGQRTGRYTTEELYKKAINDINIRKGIGDSNYYRGETYKTFAIGDVNAGTDNLYNYSASFQEGMTAAKSMILTTNSMRSKTFNINLDELDFNVLQMTKQEVNEKLKTESGLNEILEKILDPALFNTIEGRKKYAHKLEQVNDMNLLRMLESGKMSGLEAYYREFANRMGITAENFDNIKDEKVKRTKIVSAIHNKLYNLSRDEGAVALPTTRQGKVLITKDDVVKTKNELKPELGFSLREALYNEQTKNIELHLENFGVNTQGSKGQSTGAKFTISEIYDFLKVKNGDKDIYIDAIFNNKAEKRTQTGIILHTLLQTVFSNVYETANIQGVKALKENMKELLHDLHTDIKINGDAYEIDEKYLTRSFKDGNKTMSIQEFQDIMKEPLNNTVKRFTEEGKEILDNILIKYGTQIVKDGKSSNQGAHFGVVQAMQKAYSKTYRDLGKANEEIPIAVYNATIEGLADNTTTNFGTGTFLLLKLASERVNSTASKKKESALKVSREMLGMLKGNGYNALTDYMERKNVMNLSSKLGDVFTNIGNAELLNNIYKHKPDFNLRDVNVALSESLRNGILFDLDTLKGDDYLIADRDGFPTNFDFIEKSDLGKQIKAKGLDGIKNGKLANDINVVINDTGINSFAEKLKNSIGKISNYYTNKSFSSEYGKYYTGIANTLNELSEMNLQRIPMLDSKLSTAIKAMSNINQKDLESYGIDTYDVVSSLGFLKTISRNSKNGYSLDQLRTIMKTGNMLTTINLEYDVDEVDGSIVSSESFRRIENIARKNFEFKNSEKTLFDIRDKINSKDRKLASDTVDNIASYIAGNKSLEETAIYVDLFNKLDFTKVKSSENLNSIRKRVFDVTNTEYRIKLERDSLNKFIQDYGNVLGMDSKEIKDRTQQASDRISELIKETDLQKSELLRDFNNADLDDLKTTLNDTVFGNHKLINERTFKDFYVEKVEERLSAGFELLNEYVKAPSNAESLFKKKAGLITSNQKFKIDSSLVSNPLEGSNLINKFSHLMFDSLKNAKELEKNFKELQQFIGADYVNEKLFNYEENNEIKNIFKELKEGTYTGSFEEGVEKARQLFNVNMSEIAEVTITDKRYTKAFRNDKHDWVDFYTGAGFGENGEGFVRELAFFARHPQQTINHMGAVMNITIDRENKNLKNKFARAALTYLPTETNNAGVITLGKKTMLLRRGD